MATPTPARTLGTILFAFIGFVGLSIHIYSPFVRILLYYLKFIAW